MVFGTGSVMGWPGRGSQALRAPERCYCAGAAKAVWGKITGYRTVEVAVEVNRTGQALKWAGWTKKEASSSASCQVNEGA